MGSPEAQLSGGGVPHITTSWKRQPLRDRVAPAQAQGYCRICPRVKESLPFRATGLTMSGRRCKALRPCPFPERAALPFAPPARSLFANAQDQAARNPSTEAL